ncbi:hypothetical protein N656DRAFT_54068 [Canariomyces notabilis]|uniref:Uncharacterized protein n=1 Tax=Canariomyces notabilis TaxID=2074819 RepID=A0AAN6YXF0_9PEZI|nr:hypothetical protein N656DRAFT_54068 [Canariomyces arenarius]
MLALASATEERMLVLATWRRLEEASSSMSLGKGDDEINLSRRERGRQAMATRQPCEYQHYTHRPCPGLLGAPPRGYNARFHLCVLAWYHRVVSNPLIPALILQRQGSGRPMTFLAKRVYCTWWRCDRELIGVPYLGLRRAPTSRRGCGRVWRVGSSSSP